MFQRRMTEFFVRGRALSDGTIEPRTIRVVDGVIASVDLGDTAPVGANVMDAGTAILMPGAVDAHVHLNEPGRTEWEGFSTATSAAAAGGVTTVVDMPLNSIPPTTTREGLRRKIEATRGKLHVDVGLWGGAVPGNDGELEALLADGVLGFKCFMVESGVPEFAHVERDDLARAMRALAASGAPLLCHAELEGPIATAQASLAGRDPRAYATYLASRPRAAENDAIELLVALARDTGARVHVVHLSSSDALATVRRAKDEGLGFTAETTPHYLHLEAERIPDGATEFKCAPPIREGSNREALWAGLARGDLDMVVSDHSPCTPALKRRDEGDFGAAWGGIASLQLGLSITWTEARRRGRSLADVARWCSERPAELAGLARRKGRIAAGLDADLVFFEPETARVVTPDALLHRHPVTPYLGEQLFGVVTKTMVRGRVAFDASAAIRLAAPDGALLLGRNP